MLALFFVGLGGWAATAPLNAAVVGNAVVKVEGNRKSLQNLDGGLVKELRVREGMKVKANQILILLDPTEARSRFEIFAQQHAVLRATEARLVGEQSNRDEVVFPADLLKRDEDYVRTAIDDQRKEFDSRRNALAGQELILKQRIAQLAEQIRGGRSKIKALQMQFDSLIEEKESLSELVKKKLVTKPRILQLERAAADLEGQIAQTEASLGSAQEQIQEHTDQISQLLKNRSEEIAKDLRETRSKLLDVIPQLQNATAALARTEIRAPYSGKVVDLAIFSTGAVIKPGEKILDVVPEATSLVVEAKVAVEDISDIRPGMSAEVHFTSYKQRTIPLIHGRVKAISADRLTDERTGTPYYVTDVELNQDELAKSPEIQLYPGMPATVLITTEERTALDYLLGPLVASFDRAFRQK